MTRLGRKSPVNERWVLLLDLKNERNQWVEDFSKLNWRCIRTSSASEAVQLIKRHNIRVGVALVSSKTLPKVFEALNRIRIIKKDLLWIAVSGDKRFPENGLSYRIPSYFVDYHHVPIDWQKLSHTLGHALGMAVLNESTKKPAAEPDETVIVGRSAPLQRLKSVLEKVTVVDTAVLISGETGSGKGVCAKWIHEHSPRKDGPFITINCSAIPNTLLHSELFGYEKGAFTGAVKAHTGHIERSEGGTLFLDEIGDLSPESQINLLHFLEDNTIERLGATERITVDCRIIFASHIDLESAVEKGLFREDLFHRINVIRIHVPSLREHREDVELLANNFLQQFQNEQQLSFTPGAMERMLTYDWPGNIRELKNRVQRAVVMTDDEFIDEADLDLKSPKPVRSPASSQTGIAIETEELLEALTRNNHNISAAARELNISRTTLYRLIKKCHIKVRT